ncbi:MAG: hypothetical protein AAGN82_02315 [Myxococcota bacterium]
MDPTGRRAEDLARHVLAPLLRGGELVPRRPVGPRLGLALGAGRTIVDDEIRETIDAARLRVARGIVAIDTLPPPSPAEWALLAALNDLLQVTNHELSGLGTRSRHDDLAVATSALIDRIPAPDTLREAVARHASFSTVLSLRRVDRHVTWWTGSETFRGQTPPPRLLAWPDVRNVRVREETVSLSDMAADTPVAEARYHEALSGFLAATPLTDIGTAARRTPAFAWSHHTVAVVSAVAGRNLAVRTLRGMTDDDGSAKRAATEALRRAAERLPDGLREATVVPFLDELEALCSQDPDAEPPGSERPASERPGSGTTSSGTTSSEISTSNALS